MRQKFIEHCAATLKGFFDSLLDRVVIVVITLRCVGSIKWPWVAVVLACLGMYSLDGFLQGFILAIARHVIERRAQ